MAAIAALLLLSLLIPVISYGDAAVENFWNTVYDTDYYVEVSASDGGANLRDGAGVEYQKIISGMMPNGTVLHITRVATADNGKKWGLTEYQGNVGWVALSQTKTTSAPSSGNSSSGDSVYSGTVAAASTSVDYDVSVAAPDGGVNFRYGPGTDYGKIFSDMIPNGTRLHVSGEGTAANGKTWGLVTYNGQMGWVFLGQTERVSSEAEQQDETAQQTEPAVSEEDAVRAADASVEPADDDAAAAADGDTLTISTSTLLLAALVIIGLLVIILLVTIVLLTRKKGSDSSRGSKDPWES